MPDWLLFVLIVLVAIAFALGLVGALDALAEYAGRERAEVLRWCIERGYADAIRYEPARMDFCIGVVDGEWSVEPVEVN